MRLKVMFIRKHLLAVCLLAFSFLSFSVRASVPSDSKILIAYFTWADNTHVADPSSVNVDATTAASLLVPGNTAKLASWIQAKVGGDLFSIRVKEQYSSNYDECLDRAAYEKDNEIYPELTEKVSNIEQYDVIFLGFPNWWYSCPMAILSFIKDHNLEGKTIIPFCAHGTGGLAASIRDIKRALPQNSTMLKPFNVYRPDVNSAQPSIDLWIDDLELK